VDVAGRQATPLVASEFSQSAFDLLKDRVR
jgi:hypothetical protein